MADAPGNIDGAGVNQDQDHNMKEVNEIQEEEGVLSLPEDSDEETEWNLSESLAAYWNKSFNQKLDKSFKEK